MASEYPVRIEVVGRPMAVVLDGGGFPWTEVVRSAVADAAVEPLAAPVVAVEIEFRLAAVDSAGEAWDLEDLVRRTLEGMEEVIGPWRVFGSPGPGDERVSRPTAVVRDVGDGEEPGTTIDVWPIGPGSEEAPPFAAAISLGKVMMSFRQRRAGRSCWHCSRSPAIVRCRAARHSEALCSLRLNQEGCR